jgi:hypothetical protein
VRKLARNFVRGLLPAMLMGAAAARAPKAVRSFEILTRRMDVDVDGAPTAYGPRAKDTLDYLQNAHYQRRPRAEIVGYLTEDDHPNVPVVQGPHDPAPGYYISQTAFTDPARTNDRDVLRYVDASRINYVVLGDAAHRRGARVGDFIAAHSKRTGRSVFGLVGDTGNPSGDEGSLHLLQDLGYAFHNGKNEAVEDADITIRFYPRSNPQHMFFREQNALNAAAMKLGLSLVFSGSPPVRASHPNKRGQ